MIQEDQKKLEGLKFWELTFTENSTQRKLSFTSQTGTPRTVKFAGKLFRVRRSWKQHDRCWPLIGHKIIFCAQTQTSIRMSRGISSLRGASQGLSCSFFHHRFPWPNWLLQGLWGCHLSWDLSDLLWSLAQRSHKILKVRSALLRSGSLLWLVYVFNRSFQQTFVGEGLRDKPKERLRHLCVESY